MLKKNIQIVVIDDDLVIRNSLKILIWENFRKEFPNLKLFSSKDGVEGIGLIETINPDIIIVDTTLPRFSGLEILEKLSSMSNIPSSKILVIHDGTIEIPTYLSNNYTFIDKRNRNFTKKLLSAVHKTIENKVLELTSNSNGLKSNLIHYLISTVISISNNQDVLMAKIQMYNFAFTVLLYLYWALVQFVASFYYSLLLLITPKVLDSNIQQGLYDYKKFRVKTYPSLIALFSFVFFVMSQSVLLLAGGTVLFNTIKLQSVFAAIDQNYELNLANSTYNSEDIEYTGSSLRLKAKQETLKFLSDQEVPVSYTETRTYYSSQNPSIMFTDSVTFDDLLSVNAEVDLSSTNQNIVKYQLSTNSIDWYYYSSESIWERTVNGFESSNTIEELNKNINIFKTQVEGNKLYIKAFLHSNGDSPVELKSLSINRNINVIEIEQPKSTDIENSQTTSYTVKPENIVSYPISNNSNEYTLPAPTLFSASSSNGTKVIYGKILNSDFSDSDLENIKVEAYFYNQGLGEYIGESTLTRNARGELVFIINVNAPDGGLVTTKLVYTTESGEKIESLLSKTMES